MSEATNQLKAGQPTKPAKELSLGSRKMIRYVGMYPDKRSPAKLITVAISSGFVWGDGKLHVAKFRTGLSDEGEVRKLLPQYIADVHKKFDDEAARLGIKETELTSKVGSATFAAGSARQRMSILLEAYRGMPRNSTLTGYMVVMRLFIKAAPQSPDKDAADYTVEECEAIWKQMITLSKWKPNTDSRWQNACNTRFVVREIGFREECVQAFKSPKHRGPCARNRIFFPEELRRMWQTVRQVSWEQQGTMLLPANGTMNTADAVFALTEDFLEAEKVGFDAKRIKTGNPFGFQPWDLTFEWFYNREDPKATYLNWRHIFSPEEIAADPDIIYRQLSPEELAARKVTATNNFRACFKEFLAVCKITRPGAQLRNFRNTNISIWEASGVPRYVGMHASAHSKEENYRNYAEPTMAQKRSLAQLTQDEYENPTEFCVLTHNQSVKATQKNTTEIVEASEKRVVGIFHEFAAETKAARQETAGLREENQALRQENAGLRRENLDMRQENLGLLEENRALRQQYLVLAAQFAGRDSDHGVILPLVIENTDKASA